MYSTKIIASLSLRQSKSWSNEFVDLVISILLAKMKNFAATWSTIRTNHLQNKKIPPNNYNLLYFRASLSPRT